jgi:hypothetical protein
LDVICFSFSVLFEKSWGVFVIPLFLPFNISPKKMCSQLLNFRRKWQTAEKGYAISSIPFFFFEWNVSSTVL